MTDSIATRYLLDLAAAAANTGDPDRLLDLLRAGHAQWCEGIQRMTEDVIRRCKDLDDAAVAAWCAQAGSPWGTTGQDRSDAIGCLVFALWDDTPAAMAYAALEERASAFGVCLIPE
ncbi:hypothetical protein [Streptomyces megasporus]|uniref:hypothetical protein n=1 Tax=Streptomyces megasporus TaxID=44060 RepID=UPI00068BFCFA|nr:hypothetical protein [Streptomyces megasporus]